LTSVILTTQFHSMCTEVMRTGEGLSIDKARLSFHRGKLAKGARTIKLQQIYCSCLTVIFKNYLKVSEMILKVFQMIERCK